MGSRAFTSSPQGSPEVVGGLNARQPGASYICTQPGFSSPDFIDSVQLILSGLSNHFLAWKMWSLLDHWLKTTLELLFDSSKVFQLALVYFGGG